AHAKVNTRYYALYMVKDLRGIWQYVFTVVLTVEVARPGVKELHGINASINLNIQEVNNGGHQTLLQCVTGLWLRMHERFGLFVVFRRTTCNKVRRQGKGRANQADERFGIDELIEDDLDTISDLIHVLIEDRKIINIAAGTHRLVHYGAASGDNINADSSSAQRNNDIGE